MANAPSPFVKWAGGKKQLLGVLIHHIPQRFGTYFEPFLGGGALFFRLYSLGRIKKAVISDTSHELINCYFAIRDEEAALLSELEGLQKHSGDKDFYYNVARPEFNRSRLTGGGDARIAALLIYLNKTCFNGLFRVNSSGEFNVPWGRYNNLRIFDEENIKAVGRVLRTPDVEIRCCDYSSSISTASKNDFIYLDPPYQPLTATSSFTSYTRGAFSEADQQNLANEFNRLDSRGCLLLMSNSTDPLIESLYGRYIDEGTALKTKAMRQISCKGNGRGRIDEYMIFNYRMDCNFFTENWRQMLAEASPHHKKEPRHSA
jgi:DNA adenine methylase